MVEVYIGLGSNLENPGEKITSARKVIAKQRRIKELGFSSLYSSPPMGPQDQPDYVNAVMRIDCEFTAIELLRMLQNIEHDFGRIRKAQRWGARTLDLDLLLYADQLIDVPDLIVPHIGLADRSFVLYPLQEIASDQLFIPGKGSLEQLLAHCPLNGLEKMD